MAGADFLPPIDRSASNFPSLSAMCRKITDTTPLIVPAGKVILKSDRVAECMMASELLAKGPHTPQHIKKYRQSVQRQAGKVIRHYGLWDDKLPSNEDMTFGTKFHRSPDDTVFAAVNAHPRSTMMQHYQEFKEKDYSSSKKEPLGKVMIRGHVLPEGAGTTKPFGCFIGAKERDRNPESRKLIYPGQQGNDDAHALYVRSHGDFYPGEQRNRCYDWKSAGIDPTHMRFGVQEKGRWLNGVGKLLNPQLQENKKIGESIICKKLDDYRMENVSEVGHVKRLGIRIGTDDSFAFGIPTRRKPEWGMADLLMGDYTKEQQQPDNDLGKSIYRMNPTFKVPDRPGGVPTIRDDIPAPKIRALGDIQIKSLVKDAGVDITDEQVHEAFQLAYEIEIECGAYVKEGCPPKVSLKTFLITMQHVNPPPEPPII
ncbi:hypothetical protein CBR_g48686 [Chara braunii]|uniref:Uncharacterized protein n=1 Tax=Chara braunii TaxID=69332 RepID=A0A388K4F0_CHABU|nr:hypothetical protein CBR_g48686 [Chara braunii]|eukprot:GBG64938.1 hypothetical protein CBR_g48686 [Chara braunii]